MFGVLTSSVAGTGGGGTPRRDQPPGQSHADADQHDRLPNGSSVCAACQFGTEREPGTAAPPRTGPGRRITASVHGPQGA